MQRGNRSAKQNRHSPYRRFVLPDNVRKQLTMYVDGSSPLRGVQSNHQLRAAQSSPIRIKQEPSDYNPQLNTMRDHPESDDGLASDDGDGDNGDGDDEDDDDNLILAASSRLAHSTVFDQGKRDKAPPTNIKRGLFGQAIAEQRPAVMGVDKGKEKAREPTAHYNYGIPPSSLSAGQSSATWLSRPSEDLDQSIAIQPADLERFTTGLNDLIDEFCIQLKMKVEEFANRER